MRHLADWEPVMSPRTAYAIERKPYTMRKAAKILVRLLGIQPPERCPESIVLLFRGKREKGNGNGNGNGNGTTCYHIMSQQQRKHGQNRRE